jgi:release factor glutamine methyltransferase
MAADWTVQRMLSWMTQDFASLGIASPRLDAELLLSHALSCDRVRLYMDMPRPLDAQELAAVRALVVRRRKREPVAYILGRKEFYRHTLEVTRDVLVPRPETELLVDCALELLPDAEARALDLCTGSGAVAIALALERAQLEVDATDISDAALAVAARNAERLGANARVRFHRGDLFAALPSRAQRYALITANPPYVAEADYASLAPEITEHEPRVALVAGPQGFAVLERLCAEAADWLEPAGAVAFELGQGQAPRVIEMLAATRRFEPATARKDLAGIERIVTAKLAG